MEDVTELDPRHDTPVKVTVLDTVTGLQALHPITSMGTWWWTEGNGSCDCNRKMAFDGVELDDECKSERFRIVAVDPLLAGYTLDDFNQGYPPCPPES